MDRNHAADISARRGARSLSARRAWIEIDAPSSAPYAELVALRKESVDRNIHTKHLSICIIESLSARRAWIEMHGEGEQQPSVWVALRKESVDRNWGLGAEPPD